MKKYIVYKEIGMDGDVILSTENVAKAIAHAELEEVIMHREGKKAKQLFVALADMDTMNEDGWDDNMEAIWDVDYVLGNNGKLVRFEDAVDMMDDEIREDLHCKIAPCTNQYFFDIYSGLHVQKYGEVFTVC